MTRLVSPLHQGERRHTAPAEPDRAEPVHEEGASLRRAFGPRARAAHDCGASGMASNDRFDMCGFRSFLACRCAPL